MRAALAALATVCILFVLLPIHGEEFQYPGWEVTWVNDFKGDRLTQRIEVFPINQWWNPRQTVEEDGGYTYNILLKYRPGTTIEYLDYSRIKVIQTEYGWEHVLFASRVVRTWQAALQYAAEHYEWARHLPKIRFKFYIEGVNETIPTPDIIIDPTRRCGNGACTISATLEEPYVKVLGNLAFLSHEFGHAIGLGHNDGYPRSYQYGFDWRGFRIGGWYPGDAWRPYPIFGPPDTFVLYALAVRFSSLRNASADDVLKFGGGWLSPPSNLTVISMPGEVWVYHYNVFDEGEGWISLSYPIAPITVTEGIYRETLCIKPFKDKSGENLPFVSDYGNGTRLVLHSYDVQRVTLTEEVTRVGGSSQTYYTYTLVPKKLLKYVMPYINESNVYRILIYDGIGPGWDNFTALTMNGQSLCFESLKDRLLAELRFERAYRLEAGPVKVEAVSGWAYHDGKHVWALRKSVVKLAPAAESFQLSEDVRMVWRGQDAVVNVTSPMNLVDRLWKPQYLVRVEGLYSGLFKSVWVDKGSTVQIHPEKDVVDLGNGTRLVFKGFEGYNGTEIVVDKPLTLKPIWERQHKVRIESRYILSEEKYFTANETLYTLMPIVQEFGNGTVVELRNMTVYGQDGAVLATWNQSLSRGNMAMVKYTLTQPATVKVEWRILQTIRVDSVVKSFEERVENGSSIDVRRWLPETVELGNATRLALKAVYVDGARTGSWLITVSKPMHIRVEYLPQYLVSMALEAGEGYLAEPDNVVLEGGGETRVYTPPMAYIDSGTWRTVSIRYREAEVNVEQTVSIQGPGEYRLRTGLKTVRIKAVDVLGIPAPFTEAWIYPDIRATTAYDGQAKLPAAPPTETTIKASSPLGGGETALAADATEATIVIPLSTWTIVFIAAACSAAVLVLKISRRRRPRQQSSS